jgi:transposase InsO family protein
VSITAVDMLNDRVIPFFDEQEIPLLRVLTDRGTEYCGSLENRAYELFLSIEGVDRGKTKAYTPQTNGICARFYKTMKNEFYDSALCKKIYASLEELQTDVDAWLRHYNYERPHSGKYCRGKTPMQTFNEGKRIAIDKSNQSAYHKNVSDSRSPIQP